MCLLAPLDTPTISLSCSNHEQPLSWRCHPAPISTRPKSYHIDWLRDESACCCLESWNCNCLMLPILSLSLSLSLCLSLSLSALDATYRGWICFLTALLVRLPALRYITAWINRFAYGAESAVTAVQSTYDSVRASLFA